MASLSLSKGCMKMERYGKRLCELLKEQQEPFLLDEYLIQNGYKMRSTKYCHSQTNSIFSCCSSLSACKRLLKRKSKSGGSSALRFVLNKIVRQKAIKKVLSIWGCSRRMDFERLDKFFQGEDPEVLEKINGEEEWIGMEESRQLSPVSVFELHSDDENPSPIHDDNDNFKYEHPSTSNGIITENCEEMNWEPQEIMRPKMDPKKIEEQVFLSWEKIAGDIAKIPNLVDFDMTKSRREWCQFKQDINIIGVEIETLIFEDMSKEAFADILASHCTL